MTKIIPKINQIWYDEDADCYGKIVKITDNLVTMKWDYGQTFTFPIQNLKEGDLNVNWRQRSSFTLRVENLQN